jgi:hypothetical protein
MPHVANKSMFPPPLFTLFSVTLSSASQEIWYLIVAVSLFFCFVLFEEA